MSIAHRAVLPSQVATSLADIFTQQKHRLSSRLLALRQNRHLSCLLNTILSSSSLLANGRAVLSYHHKRGNTYEA